MDPSPSRRIEFNSILVGVLGSNNVYYQPPKDSVMQYPCIVYELDDAHRRAADNGAYSWIPRYQVTFLRHEVDSPVSQKLAMLPTSSFSRHFATSGVNHDVFAIYH